jgi:hypothetical protein
MMPAPCEVPKNKTFSSSQPFETELSSSLIAESEKSIEKIMASRVKPQAESTPHTPLLSIKTEMEVSGNVDGAVDDNFKTRACIERSNQLIKDEV